jgi:hypothetical protein
MSKIAISSYDAGRLAAARRAGESRTAIWAAIRSQFGIPSTVKLAMDNNRVLYRKGTDPREYLIANADGLYSHCETATKAPGAGPVTMIESDASRFAVAGAPVADRQWYRIEAESVVEILRDHGDGERAYALPEKFPENVGVDALVVDTADGYVYFRD